VAAPSRAAKARPGARAMAFAAPITTTAAAAEPTHGNGERKQSLQWTTTRQQQE
jgi:hypothetical protein